GLAVNARGADHNRSGAYESDLAGRHDRLHGGEPHVAGAIETEDRAAIMDSLILCKFLRGAFAEPMDEWAALLSAVTGWEVDGDELATTARRIVIAKRLLNLREGWTRDEDWLPERFLTETLQVDSGRTAALTAGRLRAMIDSYYERRGLEPLGCPMPDTLRELDLVALVHESGQTPRGEGD
ncbi:MAG: aldehyde ferredoxin oxidoreductase C-terminal domain-containing protein, partial [Solirubrobacteraceae bacterium]